MSRVFSLGRETTPRPGQNRKQSARKLAHALFTRCRSESCVCTKMLYPQYPGYPPDTTLLWKVSTSIFVVSFNLPQPRNEFSTNRKIYSKRAETNEIIIKNHRRRSNKAGDDIGSFSIPPDYLIAKLLNQSTWSDSSL